MATKTAPKINQTTQPSAPAPAQQPDQRAIAAIAEQMKPDVRVYLNNRGNSRTLATCSATLFGCIGIRGIHIVQGEKGPFVQMPQFRTADNKYHDYAFPTTKEARAVLLQAVNTAYTQAVAQAQEQFNARYAEQSAATPAPIYSQQGISL